MGVLLGKKEPVGLTQMKRPRTTPLATVFAMLCWRWERKEKAGMGRNAQSIPRQKGGRSLDSEKKEKKRAGKEKTAITRAAARRGRKTAAKG